MSKRVKEVQVETTKKERFDCKSEVLERISAVQLELNRLRDLVLKAETP